jgi:hypothetical protein
VKSSSKCRPHEELPIEKSRSTQDEAVFYVPYCAYIVLLPRSAPIPPLRIRAYPILGPRLMRVPYAVANAIMRWAHTDMSGKCVSDIDDKSAFID